MTTKSDREAIAEKLDRHADEEMDILRQYCELSEKLEEGPLSFLIDRVLTEENAHHYLLRSLARWLREPIAVGEGAPSSEGIRSELLRRTRRLQAHELETIDSCQRLSSELPGEDGEILRTVLDVMALDSEKHHRLLSAIERLIRA